jgi:NADH-quinone oxidoreductase subunit M
MGILNVITYIPLIGALVILFFVNKDNARAIRIVATATAVIDFLVSLYLKEYYIFLLVLQTGMLGAFMSLDFFLFYVFWEVMLVPMYFLIGIWGSANRLYAAIKFFLYTLVGSVLMLLGILALYFYGTARPASTRFDVTQFHEIGCDSADAAVVDLPRVLPRLRHQGADVPVPHLAARRAHRGADRGLGDPGRRAAEDGHLRFLRFQPADPARRDAHFVPMMVVLAIIGIVYGALVALAQKDMKKLVAYSSVSHMGFVMLGMFALNPVGHQGSGLQQLNHGISTGALFLLVGIVYERRHTREIAEYGGCRR